MKSENTFHQLKILVGHPRDEKYKNSISTHPYLFVLPMFLGSNLKFKLSKNGEK